MSDKPGISFKKKSGSSGGSVPSASALTGKKDVKRRWMTVGFVVVGGLVLMTTMLNDGNKSKVVAPVKKEEVVIDSNPTTSKDDNKEFGTAVGNDLNDLKAKNAKLEAQLRDLANKVGSSAPTATAPNTAPIGIVTPPIKGEGDRQETSAPPAPPIPPIKSTGALTSDPSKLGTNGALPSSSVSGVPSSGDVPVVPAYTAPSTPTAPSKPVKSGPSAPSFFDATSSSGSAPAAAATSGLSQGVPGAIGANGLRNIAAKVEFKKNAEYGMLPMGAFAPIVLLNGVDAGTSETARANPQPVLMTITDHAQLPGSSKYKLKSCFAMGTAVGNLSTERADIRVDKLSCVDKANNLVLSEKVSAYLVDSDSMISLRGKVIDKQGAKLGKSLLAGFAQGLSGALGTAQQQAQTTYTGGSTTTTGISSSAALRSSGLLGLQQATNQLADFYLKEAQSMFPVVSVAGGRTGTLVFSDSVVLHWKNTGSMYSEQVTPSGSN